MLRYPRGKAMARSGVRAAQTMQYPFEVGISPNGFHWEAKGERHDTMKLTFDVGGVPAVFFRNDWTGKAEVRVGDQVRPLQSPRNLSTHFSISTQTLWREVFGEHTVEIEKVRPRVLGGLRGNSFVVRVDGEKVAEATGK